MFILKGIGDSVTGKNEISPQFDAKINNFLVTLAPCVVGSEERKFAISIIDRGIKIGAGMAFAYGYFGMSDGETQFNYIIPASRTQYAKVYAEFNLASTPQAFAIKTTPQSDSSVIELLTDNLNEIPSGVYQMPLYLITIGTNGVISFKDLRETHTTIGEINMSQATHNPIYEVNSKKYKPLEYSNGKLKTKLTGNNKDVETEIPGKILLWRSDYWYGVGTHIPGRGTPGYLAVEFAEASSYFDFKCLEIVFDYGISLPESLVKIPKGSGESNWFSGGRMHIFITPFSAPAGQPNILCYPLGTLTNWSGHDDCGSGSALLICPRYYVDGTNGLFFQYIERVGNSNQSQAECSLIEIYGIL